MLESVAFAGDAFYILKKGVKVFFILSCCSRFQTLRKFKRRSVRIRISKKI